MFLRKCRQRKHGREYVYWQVAECYRTARGPRQRVVASLGDMAEPAREGVMQAARGERGRQPRLLEEVAPEWVEVDLKGLRVERVRDFGGPWLGLRVMEKLGLPQFLESVLAGGQEEIPWATMAQVLVLGRLCDPSSELRLAEQVYARTALVDLLGVPVEKVNDDRLYRALDALLPQKRALVGHLRQRLGELFELEYDLLLYDVTSTYFEGEAAENPLAQRGYSRDHRPDCKQVCIGLVVAKGGMPVDYQVFAGNRSEQTTLEEIVEQIEGQWGTADRIWVMDRGLVSEENVAFLRERGRRYILGTPKSALVRFEQALLEQGWETIRQGIEVKLCAGPEGEETFILCRSQQRQQKERAIHERFERRIEAGLEKMAGGCARRRCRPEVLQRRIGRLLERNNRAAGLFEIEVNQEEGRARVVWSKREGRRRWSELSEGCYVLRTNIRNWSAQELWQAYMQLTQAEAAFRIQKGDLALRPIWHQKPERVEAHILVCFLAYVVWKALGQLCARAGLGDEPRKVFEEIAGIRTVDVVLPTRHGPQLRRRCVAEPTKHQAILLQRLGLALPKHLNVHAM